MVKNTENLRKNDKAKRKRNQKQKEKKRKEV